MDNLMLHNYVQVQPSSLAKPDLPSAPERAVPRIYPGAPSPETDESIELRRILLESSRYDEPSPLSAPSPPADRDRDLESRAGSPDPSSHHSIETEARESLLSTTNRLRFLSMCLIMFTNGLNDSAPGALLPYIEKHYDIGYAVVSLIFVGNALGFIAAAPLIDALRARLGYARSLALAEVLLLTGYLPVVCAAPFPLVVVSFLLVGFGMSVTIALANAFCGRLRGETAALGFIHGCYGIGGTVGPLIATAVVAVARAEWSRYYLLTLGLAGINAVFAGWTFRGHDEEGAAAQAQAQATPSEGHGGRGAATHSMDVLGMFSALKLRVVLLGAVFIFAYQGAEVSISGWVISFLIAARQGEPARVGYVTSGFWAGITLGRFLLSGPAHRVGEKPFVYCVTVGAAVFQVLVWWVPNVVGDAISVAIIGLLLGPVYPCATAVFMRGMSRTEKVSGIGVISAFGSSGGAIAPFTTGILAQAVGTWVLHPIAILLFGAMMVCWFGIPSARRRSE